MVVCGLVLARFANGSSGMRLSYFASRWPKIRHPQMQFAYNEAFRTLRIKLITAGVRICIVLTPRLGSLLRRIATDAQTDYEYSLQFRATSLECAPP
ncbi:hypothetical protein F4679DRAFT_522679 [Xylaria curta]|nr:hypothetical protein F4679DRAFT_522679 [Xylaria curta]